MNPHHDIIIIGAGMAGLTCATLLSEAGHLPVVLDKGRGPGGRMAARRAEIAGQTVSFDHGAQYFTARDPVFRETVAVWEAQRAVEAWPAAGEEAWVGTPGMNGPIRAMALELDVQWGTRVERIAHEAGHWIVDTGEQVLSARCVLVAVPAEQASDLLAQPAPDLAAIASQVRSAPCWAVMAAFDQRLPISGDALRDPAAPVSWAARNSAKPGRAGEECWVLHASPERSRQLIDHPKEEAGTILLADFFAQCGIEPVAPTHLVAHRWLYAMAEPVGGDPARFDSERAIGIAGDYLHSPRVEGAYLSGRALAERVLSSMV